MVLFIEAFDGKPCAGPVQGGGVVWSHSLASVIAILMVADIFMDGGVPGAGPRQEEELQQQAWHQASWHQK